uniref:Uncharacterized protein n=1 Tax=Avena sativa TaxID=4498 RepID=A0ACD5ZA40_AVESA
MVDAPPKLLYIAVADGGGRRAFRYTRPVLQSTLQLMGCKARHAFKISKRVFSMMRSEFLDASKSENAPNLATGEDPEMLNPEILDASVPFELYKTQTTIIVSREKFLNVACDALSSYKYVGPNQKADLLLACRLKEKKESVTVLLCGTSGCGKSTLSSLLGSRLGIMTVVSTDSIRHMMRSFADEKQNPLLYASTYHAGEYLDPVAVAQSMAKRQAKKLAMDSHPNTNEGKDDTSNVKSHHGFSELPPRTELIGNKQMAIEGFKAQSEMVIDSLDRLITSWEEQKQSVIVEGVHLSLNFVMGLMKKHPSIIPFMVYITNEEKHMERFAVRAKYMTLDPAKNRYIKYIRNIRAIQEYLCHRADKHLVPKINNTNVDQSVAAIHATVFSCLRRREAGEQLYDINTNTVSVVDEEYRNQRAANSLGSKGMFQFIQRKGSSRNLMALLNPDGSVTKAWHVLDSSDSNGSRITDSDKSIRNPMVNPSQIGKAESVNLQFGSFGISAWLSDTGGTSHTGSVDDLKVDGIETGSRYFSSCCSSPKMSSDCASKEHMEDYSVYGSEEDADDPPDAETDEDLTDEERDVHEIEAGTVDEHSTKSDEEYDDLAMQDVMENGDCSDDEDDEQAAGSGTRSSLALDENILGAADGDDGMVEGRYRHSLDLFFKMSKEAAATELPCA